MNFRILKYFLFGPGRHLDLVAEFFNLFNSANVSEINPVFGSDAVPITTFREPIAAAQKHFASDVVAGGTMGCFIGRYVYDTHMSHLAHKHASLMPIIVPQSDPQQRRYGVALVFNAAAGR
jgi:hypothetical protein